MANIGTIGVTLISFNDGIILESLLKTIRNQDYDQSKINIYLFDGGSTDDTKRIALKYDCNFESLPALKEAQQKRGGYCFSKPKEDFIFFCSADNRFYKKNMFSLMTENIKRFNAFGAQSLYFDYQKHDPIFSRYCSIYGGTDPICIGLNKNDRLPFFSKKIFEICEFENEEIAVLKFNSNNTPTLGANGFMLDRLFLNDYFKKAYHIDGCYFNIINEINNKIIFLKKCHSHHFLDMTFLDMVKRRFQHKKMYFDQYDRIYKIVNKKNILNLILLVLFYLTLIMPFILSLKEFYKNRDLASLLKVPVGLTYIFFYSLSVIRSFFKK